jgi:hypothetical protein
MRSTGAYKNWQSIVDSASSWIILMSMQAGEVQYKSKDG